jgi:hypothetical protein
MATANGDNREFTLNFTDQDTTHDSGSRITLESFYPSPGGKAIFNLPGERNVLCVLPNNHSAENVSLLYQQAYPRFELTT